VKSYLKRFEQSVRDWRPLSVAAQNAVRLKVLYEQVCVLIEIQSLF
jgi:hypothetical protein